VDNFQALRSQIRAYLVFVILIENILLVGGIWFAVTYLNLPLDNVVFGAYGTSVILTLIITFGAADYALLPLRALWQAIVHIAPNEQNVPAPNVDKLVVGRALVANLTAQIYQIATMAEHSENVAVKRAADLKANFIASNLPLPLFVLDTEQNILFANDAACKYIGRASADILGQSVHSILNMSFPSENTLQAWLKRAKGSSVTSSELWERVRLNLTDNQPMRLFDLAAYYNKGNAQAYETMLVLFDHTKQYSQDDQAISFIALSVHELRTPLTLLRGYIEAFEEEMHGKLSPELNDFMHKMNAMAQQLSAFVNNILNVARVDNDQLVLQLHEENWAEIAQAAVETMSLRAKVRGITLKADIAKDIPPAAADRISVQEVINNLIDNAIKYSGNAKEIVLSARLNEEGMIETSVQDWGVGIP
jgi:NtrC-family two-component system sensor histidine kinase KinB